MKRAALRLLVAAGSGALLSLAWHPTDAGWIAWFALAPLFVLAVRDRGRGFARECLVFGFVFFSLGCAWLYELTPVGGALMSLGVAVCYFLPLGLILGPAMRDGRVPLLVAGPIVWTACEWLRTWLATGYPWLLLAHSQWSSPGLTRISAFVGAYGLSFAMASVNAAIAEIVLRRLRSPGDRAPARRAWWLVPAAAVGAVLAASLTEAPATSGRPLRLAIVQANIAQQLKEEAVNEGRTTGQEILLRHVELSERAIADARTRWGAPPDIVVWPETMLPGRYRPGHAGYDATMRSVAGRIGTPLLTGALASRTPEGDDLYNTALVFDREGRPRGRYDKVHIVPGGEYVPLRGVLPQSLVDWIGDMIREYAGFLPALTEGERVEPVAVPDDGRLLGPLICYEVIYPTLARAHARAGAQILLNLTNYGWWRESAMLPQANAIAQFRAVETGLPVVVAANTGISAVLRPDGTAGAILERDGRRRSVKGVLLAEVSIPAPGAGCRTAYVAIGDLFVFVLAGLSGVLLSLSLLRRMRRRNIA